MDGLMASVTQGDKVICGYGVPISITQMMDLHPRDFAVVAPISPSLYSLIPELSPMVTLEILPVN
jgi:hypothetical protein